MDIPKHIGFILDGNRRWAKERGLPSLEGHRAGYDLVKKLGSWCLARGVTYMTLYAFSIENWRRAEVEVGYLMDLLLRAVTKDLEIITRDNIRLKVIGDRARLPVRLQESIAEAEKKTAGNSRGVLQLAISYGGRDEIVRAARKACKVGEITEESISQHLDSPEVPDPDLIIRAGGEQRLSGFLTWESIYSELYFYPKHWPDFTEADLDAAIAWYQNRERRYGK